MRVKYVYAMLSPRRKIGVAQHVALPAGPDLSIDTQPDDGGPGDQFVPASTITAMGETPLPTVIQ